MNPLYSGTGVGDMLLSALARHRDRNAFHDGERFHTYRDLQHLVLRGLGTFDKLGLAPGTTIAQLTGNRVETYAFVATSLIAGMRSVALQPKASPADNVRALDSSRASVLVVDERYAAQGAELARQCPGVRHVLSHGSDSDGLWSPAHALDTLPARSAGGPEAIVRLAYTGGTTGKPKGVMLSNRAVLQSTLNMLLGMRWPAQPRYLCCMPMSHGAGAMVAPTLHLGGTVFIQRDFDTGAFMDAVEQHRCNVGWLVPTALYKLLDDPRTRSMDWSVLRTLVYSAAPTAVSRIEEALDVLGPCLVQLYGQTEAPSTVLVLHQDDHRPGHPRLRSAGRPFPGLDVALLDGSGADVGVDAVGEVCVRGPLVMSGYLHLPQETAAALEGGWLHTGDLGRRDDQGYIYLVDRKKDMIITGGFNVFPAEVEAVLASHPAVAHCAVIGVPDALWGEQVTAYVVLKPGMPAAQEELAALVRAAKGPVHTPKSFHIVDQLPLTNVGKVDKKRLRNDHALA